MLDIAGRITSDQVQVTSDGYRHYHRLIAEAFGASVDYAEAGKVYGGADRTSNASYSPLVYVDKHQTLKTTPAAAAAFASKAWTMLDLVKAIEAEEARNGGRLSNYLPSQTVADLKLTKSDTIDLIWCLIAVSL